MLIMALSAGLLSATEPKEPITLQVGNQTFVGIGVVGGTDTNAQSHITAALKEQGIDSIMEGSVVYGIWVPKQKADKAEQILRRDSESKKYWIELKR